MLEFGRRNFGEKPPFYLIVYFQVIDNRYQLLTEKPGWQAAVHKLKISAQFCVCVYLCMCVFVKWFLANIKVGNKVHMDAEELQMSRL